MKTDSEIAIKAAMRLALSAVWCWLVLPYFQQPTAVHMWLFFAGWNGYDIVKAIRRVV